MTQIDNCHTAILDEQYNAAVALMEAGQYEEAITAFEAMDGYKNSLAQIEDCHTAILDEQYDTAVSLMESGNIIEAYEALIALDGYKDSGDRAIESTYLLALEKIRDKKYTEAYTLFQTIPDYKDVAEYTKDFYAVPSLIRFERSSSDSVTPYTWYYEFEYGEDGRMISSVQYSDSGNDYKGLFDDNGFLIREDTLGGTWYEYVNNPDGSVGLKLFDKDGKEHINVDAYYDEYGNEYANGVHERLMVDAHHNITQDAKNMYDDGGKLVSVECYRNKIKNLTTIEYQWLYFPSETLDTDTIWKNIRIICGQMIWCYI